MIDDDGFASAVVTHYGTGNRAAITGTILNSAVAAGTEICNGCRDKLDTD